VSGDVLSAGTKGRPLHADRDAGHARSLPAVRHGLCRQGQGHGRVQQPEEPGRHGGLCSRVWRRDAPAPAYLHNAHEGVVQQKDL